jgi:actin-related protein
VLQACAGSSSSSSSSGSGGSATAPSSQTLPQLVHSAIAACEAQVQPLLWSNILLIGGGAAMKGMRARL